MTNETSMRNWSNLIMRCVMMILGALIYTVGLDLFLVPNSIIDADWGIWNYHEVAGGGY